MLPVDRLLGIYNAFLAVVWLGLLGRGSAPLGFVIAHCLGAALPWALSALPDHPPRVMRILRDGYPIACILIFWTELGILQALRHAEAHDAVVALWDRALFGSHPHLLWLPAAHPPWLTESMYCLYFLYYPLIALPPLALALARRADAFRDLAFRLIVTYVGCYTLYVLVPVYGPRVSAPAEAGVQLGGLFHGLVERAHAAGDSLGTAFPSSHVAGAFTIAWAGFRWFQRPVAIVFLAEALGVAVATVYTQNHFAIDSLAGIAWAIVLQALVAPALESALSTRDRAHA